LGLLFGTLNNTARNMRDIAKQFLTTFLYTLDICRCYIGVIPFENKNLETPKKLICALLDYALLAFLFFLMGFYIYLY